MGLGNFVTLYLQLPYLDAYSPSIPEESQHLAVKLIQEFDTLEAKEQG